MKKKNYTSKIGLMLLLSIVVFIIISVAMLLTFLIILLLTKTNALEIDSGEVGLLDILIFVFCSSLVIGLILTNSMGSAIILQPIHKIISQLNRLASGDFKVRLHFGKPIGDFPTFKKVEKSFNKAAEELEQTEMFRSDFINNFSHEFKTPIASIVGFANLLRDSNLSEDQRNEYLTVIEEESRRLTRMADNVMILTRVENLTSLSNVSSFNLSEQIRFVVLLLEEKWASKNLSLDIDFGEYLIEANEELLKEIWINLLDNAIKFADENSTLSIDIRENGHDLYVSFTNTGKEIPKDKMDHIFRKFYQVDESHSSEGYGIGLAIVKKVCDLHSGAVQVVSNKGVTTFTVSLPKKQEVVEKEK